MIKVKGKLGNLRMRGECYKCFVRKHGGQGRRGHMGRCTGQGVAGKCWEVTSTKL